MIHAPSTKPGKRGRPKTTGKFESRSELVENVIDRAERGWPVRRIGYHTGITCGTVNSILGGQE
jgi:hypothetical protein